MQYLEFEPVSKRIKQAYDRHTAYLIDCDSMPAVLVAGRCWTELYISYFISLINIST